MHFCKLIIMATCLTSCVEYAIAQSDTRAPRMAGKFMVDNATSAPLQLTKKIHLNSPVSDVFKLLSNYEMMTSWLPALQEVSCDRTASRGSNGVGVVRTCKLKNGVTMKESIVGFQEGSMIAYSASAGNPFGLVDHLAVVRVQPERDGCLLTWQQYFNHPKANEMTTNIDGMMALGFENLAKRFGSKHCESSLGTSTLIVRQQFTAKATAEKLWHVLGEDFGGLDKWSSLVPESSLTRLSNGATQRQCTTAIGDFKETVTEFDESEMRVAYRVDEGAPPIVKLLTNSWEVSEGDSGLAMVNMEMRIQLAKAAPEGAADELKATFSDVSSQLVEELVYYVENGRPHSRKVKSLKER